MTRWIVSAALLAAAAVHAQTVVREAPADVRPGRMTVTAPPDILMDGKPDRLSPGARIRNTNNLLLLSASAAGQTLPVVYKRDAAGLVHEAWVLTEAEYARLDGGSDGSPEGHKRFAELLALIFGSRR